VGHRSGRTHSTWCHELCRPCMARSAPGQSCLVAEQHDHRAIKPLSNQRWREAKTFGCDFQVVRRQFVSEYRGTTNAMLLCGFATRTALGLTQRPAVARPVDPPQPAIRPLASHSASHPGNLLLRTESHRMIRRGRPACLHSATLEALIVILRPAPWQTTTCKKTPTAHQADEPSITKRKDMS
jgi:hypothetical protein